MDDGPAVAALPQSRLCLTELDGRTLSLLILHVAQSTQLCAWSEGGEGREGRGGEGRGGGGEGREGRGGEGEGRA